MIIVHVNRSHIAKNAKDGGNRPVYTIKEQGQPNRYGREVIFHGPCKAVYDGRQLRCGARAWIETHYRVTIVDEMSWSEAKEAL